VNWPLGNGPDFRGVFDRLQRRVYYFERVPGGAYRAPVAVLDLADDELSRHLGDAVYARVLEEVSVLDGAGEAFDRAAVLKGDLTAVFFGSAVNNFGVELLLDGLLDLAPPPGTRKTRDGEIAPDDPRFSGFVFKIQSNMDPRHRDQVAFVRVCSGRLERDMKVFHPRTGTSVRLSSSHKLFGRERETVDEAYAGDVVGLVGHPEFGIGDTLTEDPAIVHLSIPAFAPEHFAFLHCPNAAKSKRFRAGLDHLLQEGVVQTFGLKSAVQRLPLLGAVGLLQFEVLQHRLLAEYGADSRLELAPWHAARWVAREQAALLSDQTLMGGSALALDARGNLVILFPGEWECGYFSERNADISLSRVPP
jgi:peptide chain release factor 3